MFKLNRTHTMASSSTRSRRVNLRSATIAGALLLLAPISAAVGFVVYKTQTQSPPLTSFMQSLATLPATVTVHVYGPDGLPWTQEIDLHLQFLPSQWQASDSAVPDSSGSAVFDLDVPISIANAEAAAISIWKAPEDILPGLRDQVFLDPQRGVAGFLNLGKLKPSGTGQSYAATATVNLAEPPLFGSMALIRDPNCSGDPLRLAVLDFNPRVLGNEEIELHRVTEMTSVPQGLTSLNLYRWSRAGAAHIGLFGPNDSLLYTEGLRRGGVLTANVECEVELSVSVDLAIHADAYRVIIVPPNFHEPNSQAPTGADVSFDAQSRRSARYENVDPQSSAPQVFVHRGSPLVVELWGRTTAASGEYDFALLSFESVAAGTTAVSIAFD